MNKDEILRLLIIDDSRNDAEQILNTLRGAGFSVRPTLTEDEEDMTEALQKHVLDLVLCATGLQDFSVTQACAVLAAAGQDLPLIAVPYLSPGAMDLVCNADGSIRAGRWRT